MFRKYFNCFYIKKLDKNILFYGKVDREQMPEMLATADIFILPSLSEGWPLSVMESLSSGVTTVVTDLPVFKNNVQYKNILNVVEQKNSLAISKKIIEIIDQFDDYQKESIKLRNFAIEEFDWSMVSNKYFQFINSLIRN